MVMYLASVLLAGGPLAGILYSYSKIVSSIRRILSTQGKFKAFSTCASHLSVVLLFYSTSLGVYLSSAATHSSHSSATASVMFTVVTPMLNPFIYSLRNKDIKRALNTFFRTPPRKGLLVFHWRRAHDWRLQSLRARNCRSLMRFFDQIVEFKFAPSIYFLELPLIWLQHLPTISVTSLIKLVSSIISKRFSPFCFFQLKCILTLGSEKLGNSHLS